VLIDLGAPISFGGFNTLAPPVGVSSPDKSYGCSVIGFATEELADAAVYAEMRSLRLEGTSRIEVQMSALRLPKNCVTVKMPTGTGSDHCIFLAHDSDGSALVYYPNGKKFVRMNKFLKGSVKDVTVNKSHKFVLKKDGQVAYSTNDTKSWSNFDNDHPIDKFVAGGKFLLGATDKLVIFMRPPHEEEPENWVGWIQLDLNFKKASGKAAAGFSLKKIVGIGASEKFGCALIEMDDKVHDNVMDSDDETDDEDEGAATKDK
jgi:hypothetical protein